METLTVLKTVHILATLLLLGSALGAGDLGLARS